MIDVVYFTKLFGEDNPELKYSIRSICQNLKFRNLVIVGTKPNYIKPDIYLYYDPVGTKYSNVREAIKFLINQDLPITEDFYLFNDDFFVMKPTEEILPFYDGNIFELVGKVIYNFSGFSDYTVKLLQEIRYLKEHDLPINNFEVHMPMKINMKLAREVLYGDEVATFRSTYGNRYYKDICKQRKDCKDIDNFINKPLLSTSNSGFNKKDIGRYIRNKFNERCKYEIEK